MGHLSGPVLGSGMQPHDVENPRPNPGNDNDPNPKRRTFWLLVVIVGLFAAITANLLDRL